MRKKTMAVLLAGAIAAAGVIGLTACKDGDDNGIEKGVQVSEEQWKAAITATAEAENYTATFSGEETSTYAVSFGGESASSTHTEKWSGTVSFDLANKKYYITSKNTSETTGDEMFDDDGNYESNEYAEADGLTVWYTNIRADQEDAEWIANSYDCDTENEVKEYFMDESFSAYVFSGETAESELDIYDMYSEFTYKDGVYTYSVEYAGNSGSISISIKDGYVIGYMMTQKFSESESGYSYSGNYKSVYTFGNFGTTTVTAPAEASASISALKGTDGAEGENGSAVAGNTFVFDSISFKFGSSVSNEMREALEAGKSQIEQAYADCSVVFDDNGNFTMSMNIPEEGTYVTDGTYTVNGNSVVLTPVTINGEPADPVNQPQTFTLSDGNLVTDVPFADGITITMVYSISAK